MDSIFYELDAPLTLTQKKKNIDLNNLGENEIIAETVYSVISTGTEIAAWEGKPPLRPSKVYPRLMGYCNLAEVKKVGNAITEIHAGDYILTHQSHRTAFVCNRMEVLLCVKEQDECLLKKITATYLYHLGYAALIAGEYKPGYYVAIVGMGVLGITTSSLSRVFGTIPFVFTNQQMGRLSFKKEYPGSDVMFELCGMDGVDIVINTSNKWQDYMLCLQLARKGGSVICLGFPGRGENNSDFNPLDSQYFYDKQLTIKHCGYFSEANIDPIDVRFTVKRNMKYLYSLISTCCLDPLEILQKEFSWKNLAEAYALLSARKEGFHTALVNWRR